MLEWNYMSLLQGHGVPKIHCLVRRSDKEYNFLVMEKLDQDNLEDKFKILKLMLKYMSLETAWRGQT